MLNSLSRWFASLRFPSYVIFFVTAKCNANCKMCFYKDNMDKAKFADNELTIDEYERIARNIKLINVLGISGGEPFLRSDLSEIIKIIYRNCSPLVVDLPTNGFFVESILKQTEEVARFCKDMVIDLQISMDGPEQIHNELRGLKDGFRHIKETYRGLVSLKKKYKNLKIKACIVYSYYNQDYIEELFNLLESDFRDFDRIVFSVAHGSVSNPEVFNFDWTKYFEICERIRKTATVHSLLDFHSLFTIALRIAKNEFLKEVLKTRDMYKKCASGGRVIVVSETGKVFPCEPLWFAVGDLRKDNYELNRILHSNRMQEFHKKIVRERCNCHWGLPLSNSLIYRPVYYPLILTEMLKVAIRSSVHKEGRNYVSKT